MTPDTAGQPRSIAHPELAGVGLILRRWLAALSFAVLCCCQTYGGGTCCAEVYFCGPVVPGCICAPGARCWTPEAP
ncbi:MAG TPA: hypothetical protein VJ816_08270 [Gemmatimonadales bacterium]|nr:hypothetical protein [Gemmatimonadales bacterium]